LIEALLNVLFNKVDIINNRNTDEGELYLRRWFIWPHKPADLKMVPRLYLHKFYTGDSDRHLHDHPWPFHSLILKGGYNEISFNPAWKRWEAQMNAALAGEHPLGSISYLASVEPPQTVSKWYGPGSLLRRGAAWAHSVKLTTYPTPDLSVVREGPVNHAWSLVFTGIKCRSWGFHTEHGWCWWRNYRRGACVCYDNPNEVSTK
jgi:hypothetical protein